jgi:KaiC/GvpD/RAD55 family RecA-like ATPase
MTRERPVKQAVSTGIGALDGALHYNGFKKGTINLYVGDPSSRKDLFGLYFLKTGLINSEEVAFYDVEASSDEILELIEEEVDPDLLKNLHFVNACPEYSKFFIQAAPARIIEHMRGLDEKKVNRVLINPLTFFVEKFGYKDAGDFIIMVREIAMKKNMSVVFLMADILPERDMQSIIDKFDGLLELNTVRIIEGIYHTIQVKKFSVQQKNVQLTYHIDGTTIRITSTGKII